MSGSIPDFLLSIVTGLYGIVKVILMIVGVCNLVCCNLRYQVVHFLYHLLLL